MLPVKQEMSRLHNEAKVSAKDKKYIQQVEKVLATFDTLDEWADYIAFLAKLQKVLLGHVEQLAANTEFYVPRGHEVAHCLALCLSPNLPNGVHQKALSIYELTFQNLSSKRLNMEINIWLPGFLPLLSYSSILLKPLQLDVFRNVIFPKLDKNNERAMTKPILLSFLAALEDETSEVFEEVIKTLELFKKQIADDSQFWHCLFLCIITNPERRVGALKWCERFLPDFTNTKGEDGMPLVSEEALMCLKPEPGLLARALSVGIEITRSSEIIVSRGFFDVLLSRLPLDSYIFESKVPSNDKKSLIMACCKLVLRKDMSLNRRVWTYFLGPEHDGDKKGKNRQTYFKKNVLQTLETGLLELINSDATSLPSLSTLSTTSSSAFSSSTRIEGYAIAAHLIMDRWEISTELTPKIFSPLLRVAFQSKELVGVRESATTFFDETQSAYMWREIVKELAVNGREPDYNFIEFALSNLNAQEDEDLKVHIPLVISCLLQRQFLNNQMREILENLISQVPEDVLKENDGEFSISDEDFKNTVLEWYESYDDTEQGNENSKPCPFSLKQVLAYVKIRLKKLLLGETGYAIANERASELLATKLGIMCQEPEKKVILMTILDKISGLKPAPQNVSTVIEMFNFINRILVSQLSKYADAIKREQFTRQILIHLWQSLISTSPAMFQVESIKCLLDLQLMISSFGKIEAGLTQLFLGASPSEKLVVFETIWLHTSSSGELDQALQRQLEILFDVMNKENLANSNSNKIAFELMVERILRNKSNRFFNLLISPTLFFDFMDNSRNQIAKGDDLSLFAYYLKNIKACIDQNPKIIREYLGKDNISSNERLVNLCSIIKTNGWENLSYKGLLVAEFNNFINLDVKVCSTLIRQEYFKCVVLFFQVYQLLITGTERDFKDLFDSLLRISLHYLDLSAEFKITETVPVLARCILHFINCSVEHNIDLNLLHVEEQNRDPAIISFLVLALKRSSNLVTIESLLSLLQKLIHIFGESMFGVLLILNDALVSKINRIFQRLVEFEVFNDDEEFNPTMRLLLVGLEQLLTISHGYLMHSKVRAQSQQLAEKNQESGGFLNNVIQGVFQIESPSTRSSEEYKLYSTLIAFHDAIKTLYRIWSWSDAKHDIPLKGVVTYSHRSLTYISYDIKFRAKGVLDTIFDLEKQEVVTALVASHGDMLGTLKLLNVLDRGRSQITLPCLINCVISTCNPQQLPPNCKTYIDSEMTPKQLTAFLVAFYELMDADTSLEVWSQTADFFDKVLVEFPKYELVIPDVLRICKILALKASSLRSADSKNKRALSEYFSKILLQYISTSLLTLVLTLTLKKNKYSIESEESEQGNEQIAVLLELIPHFLIIVPETDKCELLIVNIQNHSLFTKGSLVKKVTTLVQGSTELLKLIGTHYNSKHWRLLMHDLFQDSDFFMLPIVKTLDWLEIMTIWLQTDKSRFKEKLSKMSSASSNATGNLFSWGEAAEVENKVNILKRLTYMLLVQPEDFYIDSVDSIFETIRTVLSVSNCPYPIRIEITTILRAVVLKFSEAHLLSHWPTIIHELVSICYMADKPVKELNTIPAEKVQLILYGMKLLDELLLVGRDEFNVNSWLFVNSSGYESNKDKDSALIIDHIAHNVDFTTFKIDAIRLPNGTNLDERLRPLLENVKHLDLIAQLRLFFDSLSMIHYERIYSLKKVDNDACVQDIFNDLMVYGN